MPLTNCAQCRYLDQRPNHSGDICAVAPHYASMWAKLTSLDEHTLNIIPVDPCREFELNPSLEEKEISFSLTFQQWQQLTRDCDIELYKSKSELFQFLANKQIDHSLSLPVQDWQAICNKSQDTKVLQALANEGIEPDNEAEHWHEVDSSSCISAIAFHRPSQKLAIRFKTDAVYEYTPVTSDIFQDFLDADSKGSFFHHYIKDQFYCENIGFAFA